LQLVLVELTNGFGGAAAVNLLLLTGSLKHVYQDCIIEFA